MIAIGRNHLERLEKLSYGRAKSKRGQDASLCALAASAARVPRNWQLSVPC